MKTNITYIISNINKALSFEWVSLYLDKNKFNLSFILLTPGDSELEAFLKEHSIKVDQIKYRGKKDILSSIYKTCKILKKNKTKTVHTHLFDANIIGLTAAWLVGIKRRIHTRHHSNYHHLYHPQAVKYDKYVNRLSTDIIAISDGVKNILINEEQVSFKKIHLIHHGFMLNEFMEISESSINTIKQKYISGNFQPVIGVISRYTEWKGIQYIIPAFKKLLSDYPDSLLILANANGDYKTSIKIQLESIPNNNYIEIPFEDDVFALYQLFDIFVHVPIDNMCEAFGQVYVEALAAKIPSIFTLSGIANEFIADHQNAIVVPYKNSDRIYFAMKELLENKNLIEEITYNGKNAVTSRFSLSKMITALEQLYAK